MSLEVGSREIKKAKKKDEQLGPEDAVSPMLPSEGLKMLVSTMMTGHDDGNHTDGSIQMATWDVSRAHLYGKAFLMVTSRRTNRPDSAGACTERDTRRRSGETHGQKC